MSTDLDYSTGQRVRLTAAIDGNASPVAWRWVPPAGSSAPASATNTLEWVAGDNDAGVYNVEVTSAGASDSPAYGAIRLNRVAALPPSPIPAWKTAAEAAGGAPINAQVYSAVDTCWTELATAGLYSKIDTFYLLHHVPNLAAALTPVWGNLNQATNLTAGDYDRLRGVFTSTQGATNKQLQEVVLLDRRLGTHFWCGDIVGTNLNTESGRAYCGNEDAWGYLQGDVRYDNGVGATVLQCYWMANDLTDALLLTQAQVDTSTYVRLLLAVGALSTTEVAANTFDTWRYANGAKRIPAPPHQAIPTWLNYPQNLARSNFGIGGVVNTGWSNQYYQARSKIYFSGFHQFTEAEADALNPIIERFVAALAAIP